MKKIKVLFLVAIASIFMLTACYQRNDDGEHDYLQAFKYVYQYDEKEEGYSLNVRIPFISKKEKKPEYLKDLVPFGQDELVLPSYHEGKPILELSVQTLNHESILNQDKKIKHIVLPRKLKVISDYAFSGCSSLTNIEIPDSVKIIGNYAFRGCGLTSINIPSSVTAILDSFSGCSSLTSIKVDKNNLVYDSRNNCNAIIKSGSKTLIKGCANTVIPNGVQVIYYDAFLNCSSLTSINIPESVTAILDSFSGCSSLTSINVDENNPVYDSRDNCNAIIESESNALIKGCVNTVIPNGVEVIDDYAFSDCSSLTSINIPESVKEIGYSAFYNCSSLTSIIVDSNNPVYDSRDNCNAIIESKSNKLVYGCAKTVIPNGVEIIGRSAFSNCSSLTSINIPKSVKEIHDFAFYNCSSLTSIIVDSNNPVYDSRDNCNAIIESESNVLIRGCAKTVIPNGVKGIYEYAFDNCSSLTSINIPESVTQIDYSAFYNCSSLKSVRILGRLDYVGMRIFENCDALETIELSAFVGDRNVSYYFTYPDLNVYIFYSGTIEEFEEKFEFYENGEYIIHCSDGDINVRYWREK